MGGDGGSIPTRIELVKLKPKQKQEEDPALLSGVHWTTCAMSAEPLRKGEIVACELGNLYNKSSVIEFLLKKETNYKFDHIKSLKSVVTLKLKYADDLKKEKEQLRAKFKDNNQLVESKEDSVLDKAAVVVNAIFVCPITALHANGRHRFVVMKTCGCVLSEKAVKEIPSKACLSCGRMLKAGAGVVEWMLLNPTVEEQEQRRKDLTAGKEKDKDKDKSKKTKKRKLDDQEPPTTESSSSANSDSKDNNDTKSADVTQPADDTTKPSKVEVLKKRKSRSESKQPETGKVEKVGLWGKAIKRPERPELVQKLKLPTGEEAIKGKSNAFQSLFLSQEQVNEAPNLCSTKMLSSMSML